MPVPSATLGRERSTGRRRLVDRLFLWACIAAAGASVVILVVLIGSIVAKGWGHLGWAFLTNYPSRNPAEAGFKAALWGSVWLCIVCAAVALPLGVATAILLEEYRPRSRSLMRVHTFIQLNIRNLAGVPSIVYGIIGLTVFVRFFGLLGNPNQYDQMLRLSLTDGTVVEGFLAEENPDAVVVDVAAVEGAARATGMEWPAGVEFSLNAVLSGREDLRHAEAGKEAHFTIARDFNLPLDLSFALAPAPPRDPPDVLEVRGIVRERRTGLLAVVHPMAGRIEIPSDRITERSMRMARAHEVRLVTGEIVRADDVSIDGDTVSLISGGSTRSVGRAELTSYRALPPLAIGNPESVFYIRLPLGSSVLAGALTLMLVILPIVIISSQEALRAVPNSLREGAFAAGATRWQMVSRMVLPSAVPGIMTGSILAMSRAIGEAAPLLVIGGILFITFTPVNVMSDFAAMPLQIYQWASRPQAEFYAVAASGILVLIGVLLLFNAAAILLRQKFHTGAR